LSNQRKEHRDRMVVLSFASVLLILIFGPAAPWFVAADRFIFDQVASHVRNKPLNNGVIVSINPARMSADELLNEYGSIIATLQDKKVARIILADPPQLGPADELPGWAVTLAAAVPVFVTDDHRLADVATTTGILNLQPDSDDVLRQSRLWHLQGGIMSPSLPLAVALHSHDYAADPRVSTADLEIFLSNYEPVRRVEPNAIRNGSIADEELAGKTVFLDAAPSIVSAVAVLPSGQFVTRSEITAALLANVEQDKTIVSPSWVKALEWLAPVLLAIVAILFLPDRSRREVLLVATITILALLLVDALLLLIARVRLDIGRALVIFLGASILSWWLVGNVRKSSGQAFERGRKFLAAGRLEPAFAEFRRCEANEPLATVMYKLSLAFEGQAKPERAEAVIQWMKRTHSASEPTNKFALGATNGTPQRLGRYVIDKKIGKGAMGAVYLAKDPRINRAVALKVIPIEKEFEDEELQEARLRFFREAESAGRLTHPNIITVFDCGEDKHLAYIAMEYLQGISLTEFTNPKRLLAPNKALELCARTAEALDYAHNQGVIHRDIKPANILYSLRQDLLKISDFGVARLTDNNRTKTGIVLGTPMYMSPEQLNAETLTGHSDLFSLGVTLYELLVGEVPFKASNIAVLMTKITTENPAPVSNRRPGVPPSVDAVLFKALAKRPEDRFTNGGEMAIALRNCAKYAA
jgi:tRNA A-37 threonylcarbamoyl transferase component Bud32